MLERAGAKAGRGGGRVGGAVGGGRLASRVRVGEVARVAGAGAGGDWARGGAGSGSRVGPVGGAGRTAAFRSSLIVLLCASKMAARVSYP